MCVRAAEVWGEEEDGTPATHGSASGECPEPRKVSLADVTVLFEWFPLQVGGECWMESWEARREDGRRRSGRAVRFLPD